MIAAGHESCEAIITSPATPQPGESHEEQLNATKTMVDELVAKKDLRELLKGQIRSKTEMMEELASKQDFAGASAAQWLRRVSGYLYSRSAGFLLRRQRQMKN